MRPADRQYAKTGTAPIETVRMGIDPDSAEFLMNVFTDLYSDTMMAPIREYISNALDSHAEAGQTRPIDVRKPSMLRPFFEVEDYGLGMSLDTIRKVYSMYGYSTKRHTDEYVGMLGVGSKSGLTYSNSINITSVHDGTLVHFTISRGNKGADGKVSGNGADIDIHTIEPTSKPNGVKIQLPVSDINEFAGKVDSFLQYAKPGTVNLDGKPVEGRVVGATKVNDSIFLVNNNYGNRDDIVVAGGVPYRAGQRLSEGLPYSTNVIAYVPIGTVEFTPSREELTYTAKTNAAIKHIKDVIKRDLHAAAQAAVDGATGYLDAWARADEWANLVRTSLKYKGLDVPTRGLYTSAKVDFVFNINKSRYAVTTDTSVYMSRGTLQDSVIVQGYDNKTLTTPARSKIRYVLEQAGSNARTVFVYAGNGTPLPPWDSEVPVYKWEDIKAVKIPRAAAGTAKTVKTEPTIEVYDAKSSRYDKRVEVAYDSVTADDILLVSPGELKTDSYHEVKLPDVQAIYPDHLLVVIGSNRFEKFEREYSDRNVTRFGRQEFLRKAKAFVDGLTDAEVRAVFGGENDIGVLRDLDTTGILDEEVRDIIKSFSSTDSARRIWGLYGRVARGFSNAHSLPTPRRVPKDKTLDKYPLLRYLRSAPSREVKAYINLVYKEQS